MQVGQTIYFGYGHGLPAKAKIKSVNVKTLTLESFQGIDTKELKSDKMNLQTNTVRGCNEYYTLRRVKEDQYLRLVSRKEYSDTLRRNIPLGCSHLPEKVRDEIAEVLMRNGL